jgi:uncharacterized protein
MIVFADAFFYVALINRHDAYHVRAADFAGKYRGEVVTTQWVLAEVADGLAASVARRRVRSIFDQLARDRETQVIEASPELFARGLELYDERTDKAWSLTDCISFVVMREHGITNALTGDHHFTQAGFVALLN